MQDSDRQGVWDALIAVEGAWEALEAVENPAIAEPRSQLRAVLDQLQALVNQKSQSVPPQRRHGKTVASYVRPVSATDLPGQVRDVLARILHRLDQLADEVSAEAPTEALQWAQVVEALARSLDSLSLAE